MQPGDPAFDAVRQFDKDRFLATLFAPEDKQQHLFALHAFNVEITRVPLLVSEPQIGEIRLQWWHDTVESIFRDEPQDHPIAAALAQTIRHCGLSKVPLLNLIEAHRFDLYSDPMPTILDLEGYLGETSSVLVQLACQILSPDDAVKAPEASGYAGVAYGLAQLLSDFPRHRTLCPPQTKVDDLLSLASERWQHVQDLHADLPEKLKPAFLHTTLAPLYLRFAKRHAMTLETKGFIVPQWRRQWALWRNARK
jgi:15-cis-phytoene synthase